MTGPRRDSHDRRRSREAGEIILGWLTRLTIVLTAVGVLAYDGIAYGVAAIRVHDVAATSARVAATDYSTFRDFESAYGAAGIAASTSQPGAVVPREGFDVDRDGVVTLDVRLTTDTLVLRFIPRSGAWLTVRASATGSPG